ncbi:MAG: S8 family peptidase [Gemmatimonadaceae bacterium]
MTRSSNLRALAAFAVAVLGACAPAAPPAPAPSPVSVEARPTPPAAPPAPAPTAARPHEAPRDWQLLDDSIDHVSGISAERAYRELLAGKAPKRTVLVAVIDGGIDTTHAALRPILWSNPKEVGGNGKDDDANGYVDDVRGWNFIGGKGGDVQYDQLELTRLYSRCKKAPASAGDETPRCPKIIEEFDKQRSETDQTLAQYRPAIAELRALRRAMGGGTLTADRVRAYLPASAELREAREFFLRLAQDGGTLELLETGLKELEARAKYQLDPSYDSRAIVGDNYADPAERHYGNSDVMGPDALHGTHVSGIIGATRVGADGIRGVAPAVKIMMVRTVPDGDERDKDVANAIRYAVDNGANVINMSFGKGYSPYKGAVDAAVKYADAHGVLLVHAAGNDGADIEATPNFPTPNFNGSGRAQNWIEVGASSWKGADSLAAPFSNYGHDLVDVFAPGEDILSSVPGGGYERLSGTSMAAPVVTGLAALLMDYYPTLTASDVKRIILQTATSHKDQLVLRPGAKDGEKVPFGTLSSTGGIVNAYAALRMAEQITALKP